MAAADPGGRALPDARIRRRRRLLAAAIAALLLCVAAACFLEAHARWRFGRIHATNPHVLRERTHTPEFSEAFDDDLWREKWFAYEPGKALHSKVGEQDYSVEINSHGFRSREVLVPKSAGTFRIVCVGASTTVEGFTNESTYPALLERRLNERYGAGRFEVVNGGVSGMRAADELRKLPAYLELQPDLLLEYNAINDLCWGVLSDLEKDAPTWRWWFWRSAFLRFHLDRPFQPSSEEMGRICRNTFLPSLRALHTRAGKRGVDVVFVSFLRPEAALLDGDERDFFQQNLRRRWGRWSASLASYTRLVDAYNRELAAQCAAIGAGFLDVLPGFDGGTEEFLDICHMTPRGIERKVERIFEALCAYLEQRHPGAVSATGTGATEPASRR